MHEHKCRAYGSAYSQDKEEFTHALETDAGHVFNMYSDSIQGNASESVRLLFQLTNYGNN